MQRRPLRFLKLAFKVFLVIIALFFAFLLEERWRGQISLAKYKRELIAQGEKLDARAFKSPTNGENGASEIFAAYKKLQNGSVMPEHYPPKMQLTPSGRAIPVFRESDWIDGKTTNYWEQLAVDLETNRPLLAEISRALEKPVFDNDSDLSSGNNISFTNLAPSKMLGIWFATACQLDLHEGKMSEALDYLATELYLQRILETDRIAIGELVRIAMATIAKNITWEMLQADDLQENKLAGLQPLWEEQKFATSTTASLEGERIYGEACYEIGRTSNPEAVKMLYWADDVDWYGTPNPGRITNRDIIVRFLKRQVYCRIWRFAWSFQDERRYLLKMQRLIDILRRGAGEKSYAKLVPLLDQTEKDFALTSFYNRLRYPEPLSVFPLLHMINKAMRAETEHSLTICAIALKRYQLRHGQLPPTLEALIPEFLSVVPIDYMDGKPLKYHPNKNETGFTLYSVGEDGKDDGGDGADPNEKHRQNLWGRKDVVWPMPATTIETAAWKKQSGKY